jgi:hypothetical protein
MQAAFQSQEFLRGWLGDQTHRELVYRPLQFQKRSQLFIGSHNKTSSVVTVSVINEDRAALHIQSCNGAPQLHPALLRLSEFTLVTDLL